MLAVASGGQLCSQEPFSEAFGYSSEDFGGGSYLGVDTRDVTTDRLSDLKLKEEHGVEVTMVDQDAPAGKAGVKEHDVILNLNGNQVESVEQLRRMIREIPPGRIVNLGISRDGQPMTLKAQLADRKKTFAMAPEARLSASPCRRCRLCLRCPPCLMSPHLMSLRWTCRSPSWWCIPRRAAA